MHFLIDADSIIFKAGCANEERCYLVYEGTNIVATFDYKQDAINYVGEHDDLLTIEHHKQAFPVVGAYSNAKRILTAIVEHPRCTSYEVFISGKGNFRYEIDPKYKSNRSPHSRPLQEKEIRRYLKDRWGAVEVDGVEVDDEISIRCMQDPLTSVIVSIDKDLDNTPGWHYNYDKQLTYYVDEGEANLNFYRQLLSGDPTDGIKGCSKIGKKRAEALLPLQMRPDLLLRKVWKVYKERGHTFEYMIQQGQLLWMMREPQAIWLPPLTEEQLDAIEEARDAQECEESESRED